MPNQSISAHGTLIARQNLGAGVFTNVGELRDITPPALTRNAIETTSQNNNDDSFVVGIRRRGELTFQIGFVPGLDATHDEATGLIKSWNDGQLDGWRVTYPDGTVWIFSGYVTNIAPSAPVDDGLVADVTIRPTGAMSIT
jgi:hypothetical protein